MNVGFTIFALKVIVVDAVSMVICEEDVMGVALRKMEEISRPVTHKVNF